MRKIIYVFILIIFVVNVTTSTCFSYPFEVGEKLVYTLKLVGFPIGTQVMHVEGVNREDSKPLYVFSSIIQGSDFFSLFYKLDDRIKSYVDMEKLYSRKVIMRIREGSRREDIKVKINQNETTVWNISTGEKWMQKTPSYPLDVLSLIYWIRAQDLQIGKKFKISLLDSTGKFKDVEFEVCKVDKVYTYLGVFPSILCQQTDTMDGIKVWFSQNKERFPLQIQVSTPLGFLTAILKKIN